MNIANIIIIILLILIIIWLLNKVFFRTNIVYDKMLNANKPGAVQSGSGSLFTNSINTIYNNDLNDENTTNFMLSVWFYIDNWNSSISKEKNILFMAKQSNVPTIHGLDSMHGLTKSTDCNLNTTDISYRNLNIALDKYENNLLIDIETFGGDSCKSLNSAPNGSTNSVITRHKISNIPLQKWNCLILNVDTKTFDIYLDGKLRNSFILDGTYTGSNQKNIYLGSVDQSIIGFEGFITRVRYEPNSINPEQAYKIYREGINASLAKSLFNQYSLKVSFLEFNKEKGSFTI